MIFVSYYDMMIDTGSVEIGMLETLRISRGF